MVAAMALGAWLMRPSADSVLVWRAVADLPAGAVPRAEPVAVTLGPVVEAYARASQPLTGRMRLSVPNGALIPTAALGELPTTPVRRVTVPVDPQHAPVDLAAGMVVDVWATPADDGGTGRPVVPSLVLPGTVVAAVGSPQTGMTGELSVVLEVPLDAAGSLVAAARTGVVDLVLVPMESQ